MFVRKDGCVFMVFGFPLCPSTETQFVSLGSPQAGHHLLQLSHNSYVHFFMAMGLNSVQDLLFIGVHKQPMHTDSSFAISLRYLSTAPISEIHHCAPGHFCRPKQQLEWVRARSSSACLHTAAQLDVSLRPWHRRTQAVHYSAKGGH